MAFAGAHQFVSTVSVNCATISGSRHHFRVFPSLPKVCGATVPDVINAIFIGFVVHPDQMNDISVDGCLHLLMVTTFILSVAISQVHPATIITH